MATVEWQSTCTNLKQRGALLLKTEEWTDCTILVGPEALPFRSHKLMLAMASPVFEAMLFTEAAPDQVNFQVPDVKPETFEALVHYIYTENINISSYKQAFYLYYAANKFLIPQLARVCSEFMCCNVNMETACPTYEVGNRYQDHVLMYESLQMIKLHIREILNHKSFENSDIDTVAAIFGIPDLPVEEIELFQALERYARVNASRKRSASPKPDESGQGNRARVLVRKAMKQIRFLTLSLEQFARGPARSGLLTPGEALALLVNIAGGDSDAAVPPGFTSSRKIRYQRPSTPAPAPAVSPRGVLRVSVCAPHARHRSYSSRGLTVAGRPWLLRVIPYLETSSNHTAVNHLAVYLRCEERDPVPWACVARIEFKLLAHGENKTHKTSQLEKTFSRDNKEWGVMPFVTLTEALLAENGYLHDEKLTFEAHMAILHVSNSTAAPSSSLTS